MRPARHLNTALPAPIFMLANCTYLITGGTGSFGNAVLKRLLAGAAREVRVFSRDEKKQDDMRRYYSDARLKFYLGDVRSRDSIEQAMAGADFVFHSAALKQVPSCEFYPMEAVRTNVIGTDNVLQSAYDNNVKRVVVLSTDKAAYPINAMGISKAMMEKVMVARSRVAATRSLVFCGTRYGNVMASRGSVIPLFLEQIAAGKSLTITEPTMTRFMMTLAGAVDLVLYAFEHGRPGDLFVQKAPAAAIGTLVEALRNLLAVRNPTNVIGTRHGEKQYETLLTREEMAQAEDLGDYFRVPADNRDLNYNLYFSEGSKQGAELEGYHSHNTRQLDVPGMAKLLLELDEVRDAMRQRGLAVNA
jgi:UDP-N-acetylglucosamine 4,6-dehydratase